MMFQILRIVILACIVLCPGVIYSQTRDTLSLRQSIDLSIKNNLKLISAELNVKQNDLHLRELKSSRYPPIFFHSRFLHAPVSGYNEVVTNGGEYGVQISAGYPLYDGGIRSATIDQSINNGERAAIDLQKNKIEIAFTVRTIYYEILRTEEEIRIRRETVERLNDYVVLLNQLRLGGNATGSDVLKANVDLNNSNISLDQAIISLHKSRLMLTNVTGVTLNRMLEILPVDSEDSTSMPQFSTGNNPELQLLQREKLSAGYDAAIARGERLPVLSVTGDVGVLGVMPAEFRHNIGYSLLFTLEIPVFTWGGIDYRIERKEIAYRQIETQFLIQQRDLETEWSLTMSDLELARKNAIGYANNISEADRNFLSAKSRMAGGSGSNLEVLDAQRLLVEAKLNYNQTVFQLRYDLALALKLSGQL